MNGSVPEHDQGAYEYERELLLGRMALSLVISALFTLPLLADTAAHWFGWRAFFLADAKIQLVLATLVHLWGGGRFYVSALRAAGRGAVLALAVGASYLYGAVAVFTCPEYAGIAFKVSAVALTVAILGTLLRVVRGHQQH